jgi:hypothetical protein
LKKYIRVLPEIRDRKSSTPEKGFFRENSPKVMLDAYCWGGCNDYLIKPIDLQGLATLLVKYGISKE